MHDGGLDAPFKALLRLSGMNMGERPEIGRVVSSLPYWWNRTRGLDVPRPKTRYVSYDPPTLRQAPSGELLDLEPPLAATGCVNGYPALLRLDQTAAKHSFSRTCLVESADGIRDYTLTLLEENFMVDMGGEVPPSGFATRKFLDSDWSFKSFWEMPMATEARAFIRDGSVERVHPYQPEVAIVEWAGQNAGSPADRRDRPARQHAKIDRADCDVPGARPRRRRTPPLSGGGIWFAPCVGARHPRDPARPAGRGVSMRVPAGGGIVSEGREMGRARKPTVPARAAPAAIRRRESQACNHSKTSSGIKHLGRYPYVGCE